MQNRIIEKINIYNLKDKWQKVEIKIELKKVFRRKTGSAWRVCAVRTRPSKSDFRRCAWRCQDAGRFRRWRCPPHGSCGRCAAAARASSPPPAESAAADRGCPRPEVRIRAADWSASSWWPQSPGSAPSPQPPAPWMAFWHWIFPFFLPFPCHAPQHRSPYLRKRLVHTLTFLLYTEDVGLQQSPSLSFTKLFSLPSVRDQIPSHSAWNTVRRAGSLHRAHFVFCVEMCIWICYTRVQNGSAGSFSGLIL